MNVFRYFFKLGQQGIIIAYFISTTMGIEIQELTWTSLKIFSVSMSDFGIILYILIKNMFEKNVPPSSSYLNRRK